MPITRLDRLESEKPHQFLDGVRGTAENRLDFATTPACAADVIKALTAPKGALFTNVRTRVVTAEGTTATADIGDTAQANGYNDDVNFDSAGTIEATKEADTYGDGRLYTTADTIDVVPNHDLDTCVIDIWGDYVMLERYVP